MPGAPFPRTLAVGSFLGVISAIHLAGSREVEIVWEVKGEREGGQAGVEKGSFHSAGKRAGSSEKTAPGASLPRQSAPSHQTLDPERGGAGGGRLQTCTSYQTAIVALKMSF